MWTMKDWNHELIRINYSVSKHRSSHTVDFRFHVEKPQSRKKYYAIFRSLCYYYLSFVSQREWNNRGLLANPQRTNAYLNCDKKQTQHTQIWWLCDFSPYNRPFHPHAANNLLLGYRRLVSDASAASNKHSSIQTAFHSALLLSVAAKCYAKCCSATRKWICRDATIEVCEGEHRWTWMFCHHAVKKRRRNIYIYHDGSDNRTLPDESYRRASLFIHFNGGSSHSFNSCDFHTSRNILVPLWAQRTQELPSLICSSAAGAVATLYFWFCSAAVSSASRVKKSQTGVRRRKDICLVGSPGLTDIPGLGRPSGVCCVWPRFASKCPRNQSVQPGDFGRTWPTLQLEAVHT